MFLFSNYGEGWGGVGGLGIGLKNDAWYTIDDKLD